MTWQHAAYFISIIITTVVMAIIAWYARRYRKTVPAAGIYLWIALLVSLLSLFQGISLLGPTEDWALFWFNMRIPCFAVTPVLWLIFVFHFVGKPTVLSKARIALLFVVPVVTQAMLWTNTWHGLWVARDVLFTRTGPFFIPEHSVRVIGPFFLTHILYANLVTLAGLVVLLVMSVRMERGHRGQAAWLAAGTLIMLVVTLVPTFNLMPGMQLNVLPQGYAVGSLMFAWAIFRHRLLAVSLPIDDRKPVPFAILGLFMVLSLGIVSIGFINYNKFSDQYRSQMEQHLVSIAELKVDEIAGWRRERLGDGARLSGNTMFISLVRRFFGDPLNDAARWQIDNWLTTMRSAYQYDSIYLLDAGGAVRLIVKGGAFSIEGHVPKYFKDARASTGVILSDFHREAEDTPLHLSVIAPLTDIPGKGAPFGFVIMVIDPGKYLYPMITRWPVPSRTAETLLVRRDSDDVLFLNELRFKKNAALDLRIPLAKTETPAVMAVLGREGVVDGIDYRGVPVIAALKSIPDSPWHLVARVDAQEVYATIRERFWFMVVVMIGLITGAGAGTWLLWRRQSERDLYDRIAAADALRESEEKFSRVFMVSPYAITITRPADGKFIDVNEAFVEITGYSRQEAMDDSSIGFNLWLNAGERNAVMRELMEGKIISGREFNFRKKNGEVMTGLYSAGVLSLKKERVILSSINDITDRSRAEARLRASEKRFRSLFENMLNGFAYCKMLYDNGVPSDFIYLDVNASFERLTGLNDVVGKKVSDLIPGIRKDNPELFEIYARVAATGISESFESYVGGLDMWFFVSVYSPEREYFVAVFDVITERKRAEQALRESEEFTRTVLGNLPVGIAVNTIEPDVRFVYMNDNFAALYRTTRENLKNPDGFWEAVYEDPVFRKEIQRRVIEDSMSGDPGRMYWTDVPITRAGEQTTYISGRNIPLPGNNMVISVVWDVTERKMAELALAENEARLRTLVGTIPDLIWLKDPNGVYLNCNPKFESFFGAAEADIVGKTDYDFVEGDLADSFREHDRKAADAGRPLVNEEWVTFASDGRKALLETIKTPMYGIDGQLLGVLGIARDITDRRRTEEALQESERRLAEAREMARMGYWIWDVKTGDVQWSEEVFRIFGLDPREFTPRIDSIQALSPWPEDNRRDQELIQRAIESHEKGEYEQRFLRPDRSIGYYHSTFQGQYDETGALVTIIGAVMDITERKKAELELRESEERLHAIFDASMAGIIMVNPEGLIVFANQRMADMFNLPMNELVDSAYLGHLHPDEKSDGNHKMKKLIDGEVDSVSHERHYVRSDGSDFWGFLSGRRMVDEEGNVISIVGIISDITERKQAEVRILQLNSRLSLLSSAVTRLAAARDLDAVMAIIRDSARSIAGADGVTFVLREDDRCFYADEDAIGPLWKGQRFPLSQCASGWAILNRETAVIEDVYNDERVPQEAYRKTFVKSMIMVPMRRSDPIGAIGCYWASRYRPDSEEVGLIEALAEAAGTALDSIALYRDLEERVRERTAMLEEANVSIIENAIRIEDLYNHAPCGYHSLDENGVFVEINDTELEWLGYSRGEVVGKRAFTDFVTDESKMFFLQNFPQFKERGFIRDMEFEIIRHDGTTLPVLVSATAIRDAEGRYLRSRSTVMDFSEVKNARDKLGRYAARLEESNRELESFSYSVSHDLRAPLRSIDGFSQVILEDYRERLDDTGRDYLGRIRAATMRMAQLIDDILKLSRLGRADMRYERVDLGAMAEAVMAELRARDPGRAADILIDKNLDAVGDPALLKVVLDNLLGNAWKFTSRRKKARIQFGMLENGASREFFIRDNGVGFNMIYADKLFGPFQRLHRTEEFEGTGIGLALARRIIGRHGGVIRVESEEGKGTCFYFTVPSKPVYDEEQEEGESAHA